MQVADRDGERIRSVVRRRQLLKPKQQLDHLLHLVLFRTAVANHGALDFCRGVLRHWTTCFDRREHRDASGMPELQSTTDIDGVKHVFDGHAVWGATSQQCGKFLMDARQPLRKGITGESTDSTENHQTGRAAI